MIEENNLHASVYPNKILFGKNEHGDSKDVNEIIQLYYSIGYKL